MTVESSAPTARRGTQRGPYFLTRPRARAGILILCLIVLVVLLGPLLIGQNPNTINLTLIRSAPSPEHWLGTDSAGRDVAARLLAGGQVSLLVGIAAATVATGIGLVLGCLAGYFGGWVDALLSRITDVFLAFPALVVLVMLVAFVGGSIPLLVIIVGLFGWPVVFRIARGSVLSVRELTFVQAARGLGARPFRILARHVVPSIAGPVIVAATLLVASAIVSEAALSFLGLGVPQPTASWGNMLNEAQSFTILADMPWLWLPPGIALSLTVLAVNLLGDGLRDATDARR